MSKIVDSPPKGWDYVISGSAYIQGKPNNKIATQLITTDLTRETLKTSIVIAMIFSNTAIKVDMAAKSINKKKIPPQIAPYSILENTVTKVTKINLGPN